MQLYPPRLICNIRRRGRTGFPIKTGPPLTHSQIFFKKLYSLNGELYMKWQLVNPIRDVDRIINTFREFYGSESGVLTYDENFLRKNLTVASTVQLFDNSKEFIAYCTEGERILGGCWFDRGAYSTYSTKEISNSKFHHIDLSLPVRQRIRILNAMIDQHLLWADNWGIPVVCSTSIRKDYEGFMRVHEKRGFTVNGSFAWIDTKEGVKWIR